MFYSELGPRLGGCRIERTMVGWKSALADSIPARSQPSIPHTPLHLEIFFPGHITKTPSILIAMARTRAQTAAQKALPSRASNNQGIYYSQR